MKILYLIEYDPLSNSGVMQKIMHQSSEWISAGHTVYFLSSPTLSLYNEKMQVIHQISQFTIKGGRVATALNLLFRTFFLSKLIKDFDFDFDLLYMRYRLYMPFFRKLIKSRKVIMEINSDDTTEYKLHSKLTHYYNMMTRKFILNEVNAFVAVSHELREKFINFGKSIVVIGNGIRPDEYEFIAETNNIKPILVFIATPNQPWQGLDKIVSLSKELPEFLFYIIGSKGEESNNLKYFGYLSQEDAKEVIARCDIGIGTLSLYKKEMHEASPLKSRQYLAHGLPLIYAYDDTDIKQDNDFTLKLNNEENNIDFNKIRNFVDYAFGNRMLREKARKFAENVLNYQQKENLRLDFFKKVINE